MTDPTTEQPAVDAPPLCPYCEVDMERGFVLDFSHGGIINSTWQAGVPTPQTILGLKTGSVKLDKANMIPVATFRCPNCGYLESYARKPNS
jgi:hypothetical protein